ncbi:MAG: MarR family transcriptional regulator [Gammaproteobacteria bacterium]|nr:MarR family transcriptional regulator [Gammaproteobacteria bacterium]
MSSDKNFDISLFLPYLLNLAAEQTSLEFQENYKGRYNMLRTEWRVLFHLGKYGELTATEIVERARLHKTKISRAVQALEDKRFLNRRLSPTDRRVEYLALTKAGLQVYRELSKSAQSYEKSLTLSLSQSEIMGLKTALKKLIYRDS